MDVHNMTSSFPQKSGDEWLPMVHNPLPPPYQELSNQEPGHQPQPQVFENPAQYVGAGYHQPGFVNIPSNAFMGQVQRSPVRDYLKCSIFTTLFCCLPLGMAALIQSVMAREANFYGDWMRAEKRSKNAIILNNIALVIGFLMVGSIIGFSLFFGFCGRHCY